MALISTWAPRFQTHIPITSEEMLKHLQKQGLDNSNETGYRGKPVKYKTYKQVREDAWVHVARSEFGEETYVQLLGAAGYGQFEAEAREDWKEMRGTG